MENDVKMFNIYIYTDDNRPILKFIHVWKL